MFYSPVNPGRFSPELPRKPVGTCWLYQIRFNAGEALLQGQIDQRLFDTLGHGYVGVTSRPFATRMTEHFDDMRSGRGHLLHAAWRSLRDRGIPHQTIAQIAGWSLDEETIYEMEEQVVREGTLHPLGLNMIPGGRNGIAQLRAMGYTSASMENRDHILGDAIRKRYASLPFYRRAHIRQYLPGKFTMVSGCWVRPQKPRGDCGTESDSLELPKRQT